VGPREALVGAVAALVSTGTIAQPFEVIASCRDGLPNGGYELRTPDGRLRVAGAFAHGRKTGTFIFWTAGGGRLAVIPYDDDARSGTVALWYTTRDGRSEKGRKLEAPYVADRLHGMVRSWYANGASRAEYRYEHGELVEARAWTASSVALSEAQARRLAVRDGESDQRSLDTLLAMVDGHLPRCD
jgi:antitoxin component YwqK of YwqJK toxin-antitoxin module